MAAQDESDGPKVGSGSASDVVPSGTTEERLEQLEREREERSAATVARRAKQVQDACVAIGVVTPEAIAAAIVADRLEDLKYELDAIDRKLDKSDYHR